MLYGFGNSVPHRPQEATYTAREIAPVTPLQDRRELRSKASLGSLNLATLPHRALQVPPHAVMTPLHRTQDYFLQHLVPATPLGDNLLRAHVPNPTDPTVLHEAYFVLGHSADTITHTNSMVRGIRKIDRDVSQIYIAKEFPLETDFRAQLFDRSNGPLPQQFLLGSMVAVANEVNIQAAIAHPMTPHFGLLTRDKLLMVMPLMGANVLHVLQSVTSEHAQADDNDMDMPVRAGMAYQALQGVIAALMPLHASGAAHQDIKPENMALRRDGMVYLIDFDTARPASSVRFGQGGPEATGTVEYRSPEAAQRGAHDGRKADIWSLGVSLVVTLLARQPLQGDSPAWCALWQQSIERAQGASLLPPLAGSAGGPKHAMLESIELVHQQLQEHAPQLYPLLLQMLDVRPQARPSAHQIHRMLQQLAPDARPDVAPLLWELRAQAREGRMPVAQAIANDARLMEPQPGEREALRPVLRRVNSLDTLLRPFVSPFDESTHVRAAVSQGVWKQSPRFVEVQDFLWEQEAALWQHLMDHPHAMARLEAPASPDP